MLIINNAWADRADTSLRIHYNLEIDEIIADRDAWSNSNSTGEHFRQRVRECSRLRANHEEKQDFSLENESGYLGDRARKLSKR